MKMDLFLLIMDVVFRLVFIKRRVSALEVVMTKIGAEVSLIKIMFLEDFTVLGFL
jgi:hypothetical protein